MPAMKVTFVLENHAIRREYVDLILERELRPRIREALNMARGSGGTFDMSGEAAEQYMQTAYMHLNTSEVWSGGSRWEYGSSDDALDAIEGNFTSARFTLSDMASPNHEVPVFEFLVSPDSATITVSRGHYYVGSALEDWVRKLRKLAEPYRLPEVPAELPRIFVGHGGDPQWRETVTWLEQLGYEVLAWESLPHSGRTIENVLGGALEWANFALLVMTAEDELADKSLQARQNVVHELGLFQGRLGWEKAIVMLEEGAAEFSNIAGTNQLRFPRGNIGAKHGDVLVALVENFPAIKVR